MQIFLKIFKTFMKAKSSSVQISNYGIVKAAVGKDHLEDIDDEEEEDTDAKLSLKIRVRPEPYCLVRNNNNFYFVKVETLSCLCKHFLITLILHKVRCKFENQRFKNDFSLVVQTIEIYV